MSTVQNPSKNFNNHIVSNPYPGRGLIIGRSSIDESWLMIYWIMGRSAHSRNRKFTVEGSVLRTEPVDPALVDDPSLIIYEAMKELPGVYLVSNGDQTQTIYEYLQKGGSFDDALSTREREPDPPNYTPRISGILEINDTPAVTLNILKANPANQDLTDGTTFHPAPPPQGLGVCLTTYAGDGNPLPSFHGDPLLMPLDGEPNQILQTYWDALNAENRISIALKCINPDGSGEIIIKNGFVAWMGC